MQESLPDTLRSTNILLPEDICPLIVVGSTALSACLVEDSFSLHLEAPSSCLSGLTSDAIPAPVDEVVV